MLVRGLKRALSVVGLLLFLVFVVVHFRGEQQSSSSRGRPQTTTTTDNQKQQQQQQQNPELPLSSPEANQPSNDGGRTQQDGGLDSGLDGNSTTDQHTEVFSVSTADKKYFLIEFGPEQAINPSILPHPVRDDAWIIVAQRRRNPEEPLAPFAELACVASFTNGNGNNNNNGALRCLNSPFILPIPPTNGDTAKCVGDLAFFTLSVGPHDARVFYGPEAPYAVYGSNSVFTCFGQWMVDFTTLVDGVYGTSSPSAFGKPTELQRPAPYSPVEKNWFVFWDDHGHMYAQYDIFPKRVVAKLEETGAVGPDLGPLTAGSDGRCINRFLPKVASQLESLHQATNSLAVTLCSREEPSCSPSDANTYILTIVQHKSFYDFHGVYEPYAVLFQQRAPFELHAISSRPIWIHGREKGNPKPGPDTASGASGPPPPPNVHMEMFYITSVSWKSRGQRYHGYSDDVLFIGFGIEDSKTAGIDVLAGDLLRDMGLCAGL